LKSGSDEAVQTKFQPVRTRPFRRGSSLVWSIKAGSSLLKLIFSSLHKQETVKIERLRPEPKPNSNFF